MAFARNGALRIYFECLGEDSAPAVLLLNGAGRQCIDFADPFCAAIVDRGFRVIRFDQRDTGFSSDFARHPPDAAGVADAIANGRKPSLPYSIEDLAADAVAVLNTAEADKAHLFGRSLGSLAAQIVALEHPGRVLSLTLAMAMSRAIGGGVPRDRLERLDAEDFADAASFAKRQVESSRLLGNPEYFDEDRTRAEAFQAFGRGVHPGATARHFMVGLAAPDLRERLAALDCPVQVIHGRLDKVIPLALAQETASAIPGARLAILEDMAHEAPPQLWRRWIDLFAANAAKAAI